MAGGYDWAFCSGARWSWLPRIDAGQSGFSIPEVMLSWVPLAVLPTTAAWLVERHRRLSVRLADTAARLEHEQAARAEQAKVLERNRVARDLHDVVAHSVSVMVIQAGAARLLAANDRRGALEALELVVSCGREALRDLRRMTGVLRRDDYLDGSRAAMVWPSWIAWSGRYGPSGSTPGSASKASRFR